MPRRNPSSPVSTRIRNVSINVFLVYVLFFLVLSSPTIAEAIDFNHNFGNGPLTLSSQSPAQSLRLSMPIMVPRQMTPETFRIHVGETLTNVWVNHPRYALDYEMLESRLAVSYAVSKKLSVGIAYVQRDYFGGILDGLVEEFHDVLGIGQDGRNHRAKGKTDIAVFDRAGAPTWELDDVGRLENKSLSLHTTCILHPGTRRLPAVSLSGVVRIGLDSPFIDDKTVSDAGIAVGFSKRWSDAWFSYHQLGYTHYEETKLPGITLEDGSVSAMTAVSYRWTPRTAVSLHYVYHDGVVKNLSDLSDASHELSLGVQWRLPGGGCLELALVENIINYDNSADFGLHLAYTFNTSPRR